VRAYDPVAEGEARKLIRGVDFTRSAAEAVAGADAVVLVTEWPEFNDLDLSEVAASMRGNLLVDGRNLYEPRRVRDAGLVYEGIGRAAIPARGG
jgi:UDPglucose 6-dehydrogenase